MLAEIGNPWTVPPAIGDNEPLVIRPTGGVPAELDDLVQAARIDPGANITELIAELPPNDPALRARWAELGLSLGGTAPEGPGDRSEPPEDSP